MRLEEKYATARVLAALTTQFCFPFLICPVSFFPTSDSTGFHNYNGELQLEVRVPMRVSQPLYGQAYFRTEETYNDLWPL